MFSIQNNIFSMMATISIFSLFAVLCYGVLFLRRMQKLLIPYHNVLYHLLNVFGFEVSWETVITCFTINSHLHRLQELNLYPCDHVTVTRQVSLRLRTYVSHIVLKIWETYFDNHSCHLLDIFPAANLNIWNGNNRAVKYTNCISAAVPH